ncbi:MAG: phosphate/phosphite/phosphonate ABC transporter substrate-binding protein [Granulosicoccus sp.]
MKVFIAVICVASLFFSEHASSEDISLGVVPQQSASKLARLWTPIAEYLSEKTGHNVRFVTASDIPTFEKRLAAGDYDMAYMNPYHYTVFSQGKGYQAFARQKDKRIKGIVVVRKDSSLKDLNELKGKSLAFPSPAAFAASVLPRSHLHNEGIGFTPTYVSSHDSVYLAVARGFFPAGGGVMRTFNNTDPAVRSQLKVLWTTKSYTPHALAAHRRLPRSVVDDILAALLSMNSDIQGKRLLDSINFKGIQASNDSDWDDVRRLGIDLLTHFVD